MFELNIPLCQQSETDGIGFYFLLVAVNVSFL